MITYTPGSIRLSVLVNNPDKAANWPFPLTKEDKIYLLEAWADAGTYADLSDATDAEIAELWNHRLEVAQ